MTEVVLERGTGKRKVKSLRNEGVVVTWNGWAVAECNKGWCLLMSPLECLREEEEL